MIEYLFFCAMFLNAPCAQKRVLPKRTSRRFGMAAKFDWLQNPLMLPPPRLAAITFFLRRLNRCLKGIPIPLSGMGILFLVTPPPPHVCLKGDKANAPSPKRGGGGAPKFPPKSPKTRALFLSPRGAIYRSGGFSALFWRNCSEKTSGNMHSAVLKWAKGSEDHGCNFSAKKGEDRRQGA